MRCTCCACVGPTEAFLMSGIHVAEQAFSPLADLPQTFGTFFESWAAHTTLELDTVAAQLWLLVILVMKVFLYQTKHTLEASPKKKKVCSERRKGTDNHELSSSRLSPLFPFSFIFSSLFSSLFSLPFPFPFPCPFPFLSLSFSLSLYLPALSLSPYLLVVSLFPKCWRLLLVPPLC